MKSKMILATIPLMIFSLFFGSLNASAGAAPFSGKLYAIEDEGILGDEDSGFYGEEEEGILGDEDRGVIGEEDDDWFAVALEEEGVFEGNGAIGDDSGVYDEDEGLYDDRDLGTRDDPGDEGMLDW